MRGAYARFSMRAAAQPEGCATVPEPSACLRARFSAEAGVTLIELLVAVTLVALLSTGMAIVLRVALDGSQKAQGHLTTNRRVIGVERVIREEITNLMPVNTALWRRQIRSAV